MDDDKDGTVVADKSPSGSPNRQPQFTDEPTSPTPDDLAKSPEVDERDLEDIQLDRTDDGDDCQTARTFKYPDKTGDPAGNADRSEDTIASENVPEERGAPSRSDVS